MTRFCANSAAPKKIYEALPNFSRQKISEDFLSRLVSSPYRVYYIQFPPRFPLPIDCESWFSQKWNRYDRRYFDRSSSGWVRVFFISIYQSCPNFLKARKIFPLRIANSLALRQKKRLLKKFCHPSFSKSAPTQRKSSAKEIF